uniref:DENN domain containing 1C n=1 Tax=Leptobrachium leishanense TaxID=445787 RepID=A0A8C5MU15_9ANUR
MGSRIKENPERIFDGFFEFLRPLSLDADPALKRQFPEHLDDDQDSVPALAHFCFPFDIERWDNSSVQHFSFTLTDLQGYQRLGFCRLSIHAKSCLCILSSLPWFELFYKLLNNIAEYNAKEQFSEMEELLQSLYKHPVPQVNTSLSLETLSHFITPDPSRLPSIPENRNLTEFLVAVHVDTMLQLYSSLLFERRILITCSKLSTLTACVHASAALLYPMYWQHIYIPTLPPHLLDYIGAPMPYLIGVHSSLMEKMNIKSMEDVVIFNVDTNNLETPFQDLQNLPSNLVSQLKLRLRKQMALLGDGVSRVFLTAQAMLFGGYRDALLCTPGEPVSFCQESFLNNNKCSAMRSFLQSAVHLQLFTQFIDSRLEKLNAGDGFTDIFEQEITNCGLSGNSKSYQLWLDNLKKGGGSLINNVKSRAHPAVRNMLRYAKGQAKSGLQGMRSRIKQKDHRHFHRGGSLRGDEGPTQNHEKLQNRLPITQHFGQFRPKRPGKRYTDNDSYDSQRSVEDDSTEQTQGGPEAVEEFSLMEDHGMDLLEEIFETLNTRAPGEERALYGTHSLDFFNLEDNQYFTRFQSINQTSEEDLSMSQPRDSSLWYLQEEDEGSFDQTDISSELTSLASESLSLDIENPSQNVHDIPPPQEETSTVFDFTPSTRNMMAPEASLTTSNDASATEKTASQAEEISPDEEAKSSTKEVAPPTMTTETQVSEAMSSYIDTPRTDINLVIDKVTSQMKATSSPTPVSDGSPMVVEKGKTTEHPSPNQMEETAENANTTSAGASYDAPDPCIQARVQNGPLDPRLMWPGTKREAAQKVMEFINQQQKNTAPTSNRKSGTLTLHSVPKTHTGQQLKTQPRSPSISTGTKECMEDGVSQKSAEFVPLSLPKVSELKKRFEV